MTLKFDKYQQADIRLKINVQRAVRFYHAYHRTLYPRALAFRCFITGLFPLEARTLSCRT